VPKLIVTTTDWGNPNILLHVLIGLPGETRAEEDQVAVRRARRIGRFLSQNMFVAEAFTGQPGSFVPLAETLEAFKALTEGTYDHVPEQAFFMCGGLEDLERNADKLAKN